MLDGCEFPGKAALEALFLSPLVVPAVVIGFALLLFFALLGVFDGFTRLLGGHIIITLPYTVRTTLAGLVGIRKTLTEAAMSLGANERRAFWDVTFPLARTGMVAGAVFAFAFSMDDVAVSLFLEFTTIEGHRILVRQPDGPTSDRDGYEICIRPERIGIDAAGSPETAAGPANRLGGTVRDIAHLGAVVHLVIKLEGGRRITATEQYLGQPLEQTGKSIDLVFRPEDCIIVPADS